MPKTIVRQRRFFSQGMALRRRRRLPWHKTRSASTFDMTTVLGLGVLGYIVGVENTQKLFRRRAILGRRK